MKKLIIVVCIVNLYLNGYTQCGPNEPYYLGHTGDTTCLVSDRCCGNVMDDDYILNNQNKLTPTLISKTLYMSGNAVYNCCKSKKIQVINQDTLIIIYGIQSDTGLSCTCDCYNLIVLYISTNSKKVHVKYGTLANITLDTVVNDQNNSIKTNNINLPVHVFPNPAVDNITIEFSNNVFEHYDLRIIDISGKSVYKFNSVSSSRQFVDLRNLKPGIYFYEIIFNSQQIIRGKINKI